MILLFLTHRIHGMVYIYLHFPMCPCFTFHVDKYTIHRIQFFPARVHQEQLGSWKIYHYLTTLFFVCLHGCLEGISEASTVVIKSKVTCFFDTTGWIKTRTSYDTSICNTSKNERAFPYQLVQESSMNSIAAV